MLITQVRVLSRWHTIRRSATARLIAARDDERGEVTAWTVLVVLMVAGAATVGSIIVAKMIAEATGIQAGN